MSRKPKNGIWILCLFAGSRVLAGDFAYLGDSHSSGETGLFAQLKSQLESKGKFVAGLAVCGARISDFLSEKDISGGCTYKGVTYLKISDGRSTFEKGPGTIKNFRFFTTAARTVIVQLGDNHLDEPDRGAQSAQILATKILASKKACIWIGPAAIAPAPTASPDKCRRTLERKRILGAALKDVMASTVIGGRRCIYIDSLALTASPTPLSKDCMHYVDYSIWAKAVAPGLLKVLK